MTDSPESPADAPAGTGVPEPRQAASTGEQRAAAALTALRPLGERLARVMSELDDSATAAPCALPGWSRAHLISHLARNADAMLNLLTWAKTGVEHQAYASDADRDADIEKGAKRVAQMLQEDLAAASGRLHAAFEEMPA
ncbi:MAG: maleylpyruvate isomerase N-terminal domain-containing protein, partial [Sciscionella sp.]